MKKIFLSIAIAVYSLTVTAQAPSWLWSKNIGGPLSDLIGSMTTDAQGNVYVTGNFNSAEINIGSFKLKNSDTSAYRNADVFLAKYNSSGNVIWAKTFGSNGYEGANAIAIDESYNIYVGGIFSNDTIIFNGDTLMNSAYEDNIFILKYDSSSNELWAKQAGNNGKYSDLDAMATDKNGSVYFTGTFRGLTISFDQVTLVNPSFNGNGQNLFIVKFDGNGNTIWARNQNTGSDASASTISFDALGHFYIGGSFMAGQLRFSTDTLNQQSGYYDAFLAKYDTVGNAIWGRQLGKSNSKRHITGNSLFAEPGGNLCFVGSFDNDSLVLGNTTLRVNGAYNMFVAKYDSYGNVLWAKNATGTGNAISANSVTGDLAGNYYVGGRFYWPTEVIGDDTLINDNTQHYTDMFVAKYNSSGKEMWAKSNGGYGNDEIDFLSTDSFGNLYAAGLLGNPTVSFDTITVNTYGPFDVFVAKISSQILTTLEKHDNRRDVNIFPNPFSSQAILQTTELLSSATLTITNCLGETVGQVKNIHGRNFTINRGNLPGGMYFIQLTQENKVITTGKLMVGD